MEQALPIAVFAVFLLGGLAVIRWRPKLAVGMVRLREELGLRPTLDAGALTLAYMIMGVAMVVVAVLGLVFQLVFALVGPR
jgi:hypothetical protein